MRPTKPPKPLPPRREVPDRPELHGKRRDPGRPPGSFTQHKRVDKLRSLLEHAPRGLTLAELGDGLGVSERTVRRYLAELGPSLDLKPQPLRPGGAQRWAIDAQSVPRRVELRRTQAYALLAARRMFLPMKGSALYEEIDLAIQRLVAIARRPGRGPNAGILADARLEDRFLYLPYGPKDYAKLTDELDDLFQAVADLRPLTCTYRSTRDGTTERVVIHPYALVLYKEALYAVGLHVGRGEVRTFLLDRMRDTELASTERFELPASFRIDDWFDGQFGVHRGSERHKVVVDFAPRVVEFVRSRKVHASQRLTALPGGGVRLTMTVGDLTEVATWVLGWGETARVVEPQALRETVVAELSGALAGYGVPRARPKKKRA